MERRDISKIGGLLLGLQPPHSSRSLGTFFLQGRAGACLKNCDSSLSYMLLKKLCSPSHRYLFQFSPTAASPHFSSSVIPNHLNRSGAVSKCFQAVFFLPSKQQQQLLGPKTLSNMEASRCFGFGSSLSLEVLETGPFARLMCGESSSYEHAWKFCTAAAVRQG